MKQLPIVLLAVTIALPALACGDYSVTSLNEFAAEAASEDSARAEQAITSLRAAGPEGLQALLAAHADIIDRHSANSLMPEVLKTDPQWERLRHALDEVGQQRDCYASELYWFTDFEQAKSAANACGKPILSLRLLGMLDEEFSCANSRFFRTTLYANAEVSQYLRDHFVLHWKSVRPVPRVTIDFGDGRKLERTITGNSIHYVLNSNGEIVDALPGLYGAKAFLRGLQRAEEIAQRSSEAGPSERKAMFAAYHKTRMATLDAELNADLQRIGLTPMLLASQSPEAVSYAVQSSPTASTAATIAVGKRAVEAPILDRTTPTTPTGRKRGGADIDDATWQKIAALHAEDAALDPAAKNLIRAKGPNAIEASRVSLSKSFVEDPMLRKLRIMERSISEDTVRNEYLLHRQIHEWLVGDSSPKQIDALNAKVYAELFLTPDSDPWLGLLPADAYAALENDGLTITANR